MNSMSFHLMKEVCTLEVWCWNSVPDPAILVKNFNVVDFVGKWFITSGLNPTFNTFDCQLHKFHTESKKLVGNLSWRIRTPDTGFFTRSTVQRFCKIQSILQCSTIMTMSSFTIKMAGNFPFTIKFLPESSGLELEMAAKSIGRDFNKFISTDNKRSWKNIESSYSCTAKSFWVSRKGNLDFFFFFISAAFFFFNLFL